jgi:hypothetical protein
MLQKTQYFMGNSIPKNPIPNSNLDADFDDCKTQREFWEYWFAKEIAVQRQFDVSPPNNL